MVPTRRSRIWLELGVLLAWASAAGWTGAPVGSIGSGGSVAWAQVPARRPNPADARTATLSAELRDWPASPVRWLLQERELQTFRALTTPESAMEFIREFWRRRDPTPGDAENPFADEFTARVKMADTLFTDELSRGALTDRGGALILLGSPTSIRVLRRQTPNLRNSAARGSDRPEEAPVPNLGVEVERWRYPRQTVSEALGTDDLPEQIELEFVRREHRVHFASGRIWVERAAKAALSGG